MSWFKKEGKVSYYDKEGRRLDKPVVTVIHEPKIRLPERRSKTPKFDAAVEQYYEKHPNERRGAKVKKAAVGLGKRLDTWSKNYSKSQRGSGPMLTWNPPQSKGGGKSPLAMDIFNFGGPGGTSHKKTGKSSGDNYIIRGGRAYKVAKTGKTKKSSVKKKKYDMNDPFDFPRW